MNYKNCNSFKFRFWFVSVFCKSERTNKENGFLKTPRVLLLKEHAQNAPSSCSWIERYRFNIFSKSTSLGTKSVSSGTRSNGSQVVKNYSNFGQNPYTHPQILCWTIPRSLIGSVWICVERHLWICKLSYLSYDIITILWSSAQTRKFWRCPINSEAVPSRVRLHEKLCFCSLPICKFLVASRHASTMKICAWDHGDPSVWLCRLGFLTPYYHKSARFCIDSVCLDSQTFLPWMDNNMQMVGCYISQWCELPCILQQTWCFARSPSALVLRCTCGQVGRTFVCWGRCKQLACTCEG